MQQPYPVLQDCEKKPPPLVSLICSWTDPWVWVQEEVKKWLEIHNIIHREKDFTALYIYRLCQSSWGWSKSFAWISGHSCIDRLFLGTFTDMTMCSLLQRLYQEEDNLTVSDVTFHKRFQWVSTKPARTGLSSSQISPQVSSLARGLPQGPSSAHGVLKWEKLQISSPSAFFSLCFQGLSIKFPSPFFFSLHWTSDGSIWIKENYL